MTFVLQDKGVNHGYSLAKKAATFFKISISISRRRFTAQIRWFSSSKGESLPRPRKASLPWDSN